MMKKLLMAAVLFSAGFAALHAADPFPFEAELKAVQQELMRQGIPDHN